MRRQTEVVAHYTLCMCYVHPRVCGSATGNAQGACCTEQFPSALFQLPLSAYNGDHAAHEGNWASQAGIHLLPNPMTGQGTLYAGVLFYSGMSPREIVEYL